jgi:hypothetical protein
LSKEIIAGRVRPGETVRVDLDPAGSPTFEPTAPAAEPAGVETA